MTPLDEALSKLTPEQTQFIMQGISALCFYLAGMLTVVLIRKRPTREPRFVCRGGFRRHDGNGMPCHPNTWVDVQFRCGETDRKVRAGNYGGWSHRDYGYDIVGYRAYRKEK